MQRKLPRWLKRASIVLACAALAIQLVPAQRTNPPANGALAAPPEVEAILRRACYDCHSNETIWPWYSFVAPVSWLVVADVDDGRRNLNFSTWDELPDWKRAGVKEEIVEQVRAGYMPLGIYLRLHPQAAVTEAEIETLAAWASVE
jgi:hypothetical protein